ncbi:transcriptional regulator [Anaerocolumna cellulosilytica]|uniref:Transcriptional regulator n=1 Tax=Anaerocolumna cellulosilytica TaxID=433286 RepID=A0A6S6R3I9_9FIRM|nr:helix-turn-helix transcriptional regulator [Anaerocolumna cellulosilytica]MBB5196009.1 transcriptional regulator with XRE-family HTH domain [Anaerocolumna cellulosilytica]BCJ93691.1 transcriptional regulator [Anaerocolumna cellulosilytica]
MTFGQKLKTLRKEHSYSQEELAQILDVSRQAVSKWESDRGIPEIGKLVQISTIFEVTLDYLLKMDYTEENLQSNGYYVSREMIDGFLSYKRQGAKRIAIGVSLMVLANLFDDTQSQLILILYWITISLGVAVLVWQIFQQNHYKVIGTKQLLFDEVTINEFRQEHEKTRKLYIIMIIVAILILILSPEVLSILGYSETSFGLALSWVLQAVWLSLIILAGITLHAERIIAQNTEYMNKKSKEGKYTWIYIALPVTALAVAIGIFTNAWSPVAPILVLFCALLVTVCKLLLEGRNKNE